MIKSLSLSIDEIRQLVEISDPEHRRQVLRSLAETAETTQSEINPETYADNHPMALRIAQKIQRKARAAMQRRLSRKSRQEKTEQTKKPAFTPQQSIEARIDDFISIDLNDATVGRLLWIKQNHPRWIKAIRCIVAAIAGSDIPERIARQLTENLNALFAYIRPLISHASGYHSTPRRFRPRFATISPILSQENQF